MRTDLAEKTGGSQTSPGDRSVSVGNDNNQQADDRQAAANGLSGASNRQVLASSTYPRMFRANSSSSAGANGGKTQPREEDQLTEADISVIEEKNRLVQQFEGEFDEAIAAFAETHRGLGLPHEIPQKATKEAHSSEESPEAQEKKCCVM